jgi:hypothetical protein
MCICLYTNYRFHTLNYSCIMLCLISHQHLSMPLQSFVNTNFYVCARVCTYLEKDRWLHTYLEKQSVNTYTRVVRKYSFDSISGSSDKNPEVGMMWLSRKNMGSGVKWTWLQIHVRSTPMGVLQQIYLTYISCFLVGSGNNNGYFKSLWNSTRDGHTSWVSGQAHHSYHQY